jgi:hypothetical protein
MFAFIYDNLFTCDVLTFIALMSTYIPLYVLIYKNTQENDNIEMMMVTKIQELQIENTELRKQLYLLREPKIEESMKCKDCSNTKEAEDDSLCHECYHKSCYTMGDKCWCEEEEPVLSVKKPVYNIDDPTSDDDNDNDDNDNDDNDN